jgi:Zn-dependent protease
MVSPRYYKHPRRDDILVSVAGPLMNLLIAVVFFVLLKIMDVSGVLINNNSSLLGSLVSLLYITAHINIVLFVLNMIPFPMFDGYHVISNIFNTWKYRFFTLLEQYGMFIFIFLAITGILGRIISPIVNIVEGYLFTLIVR